MMTRGERFILLIELLRIDYRQSQHTYVDKSSLVK